MGGVDFYELKPRDHRTPRRRRERVDNVCNLGGGQFVRDAIGWTEGNLRGRHGTPTAFRLREERPPLLAVCNFPFVLRERSGWQAQRPALQMNFAICDSFGMCSSFQIPKQCGVILASGETAVISTVT
jgi:hypothetical protein